MQLIKAVTYARIDNCVLWSREFLQLLLDTSAELNFFSQSVSRKELLRDWSEMLSGRGHPEHRHNWQYDLLGGSF